jgi:hypothetical protein
MDLRIAFACISTVIGIACFVPYIRDILRNTTKPHSYTWLIWAVLQSVAAAAMWSAGAGIAIASSAIGAGLCAFIFVLSLWRGSEHITVFDTVCLLGAICSFVTFLFLHNPQLSVVLAALTDVIGFLPTFRKTLVEPETETASTHLLSGLANVFALAALAAFNVTTVLYLAVIMVLDFSLGFVVVVRTRTLK